MIPAANRNSIPPSSRFLRPRPRLLNEACDEVAIEPINVIGPTSEHLAQGNQKNSAPLSRIFKPATSNFLGPRPTDSNLSAETLG